jgi:YggT family protein
VKGEFMAIRAIHPTQRVRTVDAVDDDRDVVATAHPASVVERIVWLVAGILLALLAFRFVLALLGANPNNSFANFIYTTSHPFVAPFFNLFRYNYINDGIGRFEFFTLIAMAVYAVIAAVIARVFTLNRP